MGLRVVYSDRQDGPERLVNEAELIFDGAEFGPLNGMKLVGFSLWRSPDGEVYVTFPSRAFGTGSERRFFDFLRTVDPGSHHQAKEVKAFILRDWNAREKEREQ